MMLVSPPDLAATAGLRGVSLEIIQLQASTAELAKSLPVLALS